MTLKLDYDIISLSDRKVLVNMELMEMTLENAQHRYEFPIISENIAWFFMDYGWILIIIVIISILIYKYTKPDK